MAVTDSIVFYPHARQFGWLVFLLLLLPVQGQASGVTIEKASTRSQDGVYQLNADIRYDFSKEVLEAIDNGVAITLQVTIRIERFRPYLWDESITTLFQRYELKYHALSGQYLVKTVNTGEQRSYLSLASALRALGRLRELPILEQSLLKESGDVVVLLHSKLDTNALPAPLRPVAWLSSNWKLSSEWFTCPLQS